MREDSSQGFAAARAWGSSRRLRVTVLACLALLGFVSTYAFAAGSHAATATTTLPNPDPPPPTTTRRPLPPPPPPPPPPPVQTYVAPPPPAAAVPFTPPRTTRRPRVVRKQAHPKRKATVVPASTTGSPPPPPEITQGRPVPLAATVVPAASLGSGSSSILLPLLLGIALGLSFIVIAIALTPPWALPRSVGIVVYEQRDQFVYGGIATALSIGLGLLITLAAS
jgi:hypothetical protein